MGFTDNDLVQIGARFSTQRLLEQGDLSVASARAHATDLGGRFPKPKVDELEGLLGQIRKQFDAQAEGKFIKDTAHLPVAALLGHAKHWISDTIAVADNAFEEDPKIADQFHKAGKLGQSIPAVAARMQSLIAVAADNMPALKPWGLADADLVTGKKVLADLTAANTKHEQTTKDLPAKTRDLYILKGKAYLLMKKLNRTGRRVFHDNPTAASKLNLSVLKRHGHKHGAAEKTPTEEKKA